MGTVHVPQERSLFPLMTVWDNVLIGGHMLKDQRLVHRRAEELAERFPLIRERRRDGRARSPAGSRSSSRSPVRCCSIPRSSSWTSLRWASIRSRAARSSTRSVHSTTAGAPSCSSSRTRAPASRSHIMAPSWTPGRPARRAERGSAAGPSRRRALPRCRAERAWRLTDLQAAGLRVFLVGAWWSGV